MPPDWLGTCYLAEERHTVGYLSDFFIPTHPEYRGALVDNDKRVGVRLLEPSDRTVEGARKIFDDLFWTAGTHYPYGLFGSF